ncbi:hypothetical protein SARC_01968 [Sphaeroforma arctica JP610]|uniref:Phospholipid/glycerol acyltransferase domain-containing protein n=1 Tax=Sphaeroforma arctica JP610 TaxID=667725 RepID=A0A0L0GAC7_9EUKA|nr:hypothetical protein SARC_01968 [Sphaeroforma arctica JP610]KNC85859.1 hypothetical protein SARC_01968 [Sphaeroforma arctica JP610]|eukprot:XP_014159761.1 hypothetical protein SARC_01968 [Sphaeroforma arctica JP610]
MSDSKAKAQPQPSVFVPADVDTTAYEKRLQQIKKDLKSIASLGTRYERNVARREVWRDNELLLMDLEDAKVVEEAKTDSKWQKENQELRDQLTIEPVEVAKTPLSSVLEKLRYLALLIWFFGGLWIIFLSSPLRWCHPALRRLGIPNDFLPIDIMTKIHAKGLIKCTGVIPSVQGAEEREYPPAQPYLTMFAHPSNLDPIVLLGTSPVIHKAIGKQSLFLTPIIGWAMRFAMGSVPVDRGSLKKAKQQLDRLKISMQRWGRCLMISPEGTRQPQGQLQPFKKGPFHLQHDLNCAISPVIHFGPFELWPRSRKLSAPGHVIIRYLPLYYPKKGADHNQVRRSLRRYMLEESCKDTPKDAGQPLSDSETIQAYVFLVFVFIFGIVELWGTYSLGCLMFHGWSVLAICIFLSAAFVGLELAVFYGLSLPTSGDIIDRLTGHTPAAVKEI